MFKFKEEIENDFWDGVFESIWGTYRDEENELYRNVYKNEIDNFIDNLKTDLAILLKVYGVYYPDDVEKLFAIQFYGTFNDLENPENLENLAMRFDEIYCGDLGDRPNQYYNKERNDINDIDGWYE